LNDVSEVLTASILKAMSKPRAKKWVKKWMRGDRGEDSQSKGAVITSETSVNFYETTQRNIP
jgi:hypothetical protein